MTSDAKRRNLNRDELISIFNSNVPKKKYFNSLINNTTPIILDNQFCYNIQNEIRQISNFNPYDTDIKYNNNFSHKFNYYDIDNYNDNYNDDDNYNDNDNDNYNRKYMGNKTMINLKQNNDEIDIKNNNFTFYNQMYNENENKEEEDENGKNQLFISKINQYLNNSIDYENIFNEKEIKQNFSSPKFKLKYSNELNKSRHSLKNHNKKKVYYTDLEKGLINNKIKSTNFSSKNSFCNENHKNEIKRKGKKDIKNINKVHISNINNKIRKIHVNSFISNKKRENITEQKHSKKTSNLRSTVQYPKKLNTIDEFMGLKANKSKQKNSHSKKKENNKLLNIKNSINECNKKDKLKVKSKGSVKNIKRTGNKKYCLDEESKVRNANNLNIKNNDNDDKNDINNLNNDDDINHKNEKKKSPKKIKKNKSGNKSNPKMKSSKTFFNSFLCCFGYGKESKDNSSTNIYNRNTENKIKIINTDINVNNNLNERKTKNKISKKKKRKKSE